MSIKWPHCARHWAKSSPYILELNPYKNSVLCHTIHTIYTILHMSSLFVLPFILDPNSSSKTCFPQFSPLITWPIVSSGSFLIPICYNFFSLKNRILFLNIFPTSTSYLCSLPGNLFKRIVSIWYFQSLSSLSLLNPDPSGFHPHWTFSSRSGMKSTMLIQWSILSLHLTWPISNTTWSPSFPSCNTSWRRFQ